MKIPDSGSSSPYSNSGACDSSSNKQGDESREQQRVNEPAQEPVVLRWLDQNTVPTPNARQLKSLQRLSPGNDHSGHPLNDSNSFHAVPRQDALVPNPESEVVIHSKVTVTAKQQPGLIARTRASCLNLFQRCFGRAPR